MDEVFGSPSDEPISVAILGSTGSIGRQALDVIKQHPDRYRVTALSAGSDAETLIQQVKEFDVPLVGIATGSVDAPAGTEFISGPDSAEQVAAQGDASIVLNAVVGAAGLKATLATIASGKTLALANKESLVAAGELVMAKAEPGQIRPVDSEHSALWQLLERSPAHDVGKVFLTGSGGPFRGKSARDLTDVGAEDALRHPVWEMGPKITIDSATLMNKGLEVIEAHFLFGFTYDEIEVLIHPQGKVHAIVETIDGNSFAHLGVPDMRIPIQVALSWPERHRGDVDSLAWGDLDGLSFESPDTDTFRCLPLAYHAGRLGDTYPAVLNAANEVAVHRFLEGSLDFLSIPAVVEQTLEAHEPDQPRLEEVLAADRWARRRVDEIAEKS